MMSFTSQLQSYAVHRMLAKTAVCVLVYFSCFTIGRISASTASMATSVTVHPPSIVISPTAISPTKTTLLPSSTSSTSLPHNVSFQISIQLTDTTWSDELFNNKTPSFRSLSSNLTTTVSGILKNVGDASVEILEFKPGSVIAVFKVTALSSQESGLKNRLIAEMRDGKLGAFAVEPVLYSGRVFDVILKLNIVCNDSATDKGFVQKGSLENAIITKLNSSNKSVTAANIRLVDCPQDDNENITILTVRVQLKDLSAVNPNKELRSLKDAVDGGRVGNFSVVPEWKSYIPGEKLFHLKATVVPGSADALRNKTVLEALITEKFKGKSNFRYANVEVPDNTTLEIDIGMDSSTSELPFIALDVFARELQVFWPKLGNLKLFRNTIRVTVEPKSLTKKTFEVTFAQNVPNCDPGKIADSNSSHFKNLSDGAREFIDSILKADKKVGPFYLETEVMRLSCLSNTTVRSVSFAYLKPTAEDKIGLLFPLLKCKVEPGIYDGGVKVQLKTPTSVLVRGIWNVLQGVWIHWVCLKPPKPKPPTQGPTDLYTTTGPTTAITTGTATKASVLYSGRVFDVILKLNIVCNDSATDKGFVQKGSLENAIITKLNSSNKSVTAANIRLVDCPQDDNENITILTVRVQLKDLSAVNPNKELRSLKDAVDGGRVGNFSVVPEWKSYIPGEKLFHLKATVVPGSANALRNKTILEALITERFKSKSNFRYANVEVPDNTTLEIDIGMNSSTSELPFIALDVLATDLPRAKLGNLHLIRKTVRVTVEPKSLTKKTFEVTFAQNVPNCDPGKIADSNSSHFKDLSDGAREFIDSILKADKKVSPFYLRTEVMRLSCHNGTTVRSVSYAYLKPTAEDKIGLLFPLLKCKVEPGIYDWGVKVQLKTPTSVLVRGIWNVLQGVWIHWVCLKPPKPKPPTQEPTDLYTTKGLTTAITTGTISNTTTTTRGPLPTTESKPQLFLKVGLGMTWGEFCSKQEIFKERIAANLEDSNGTELSPDRIIYANVAENCADPSKHDEMAEVWFYVSKAGSKDLDESLTLKAFELFSMFFENANTKQLGPDFEEKVINVVLAGSEASKYETKTTCGLSSLHIILIAVAGTVGLFLMLLACCCLFCCSKSRKRKSPYKYESKHHHAMHIIHVDAGAKDTEDRDKNANKEENKFVGEKEGRRDIKEDISDGGHENDGYDCLQDEGNNSKSHKSDNKETSNDITAVFNERQDISARERSLDKGVNSATGEAGVHQGERSHSYENLNTGNADYHTYESVSKASGIADKNSSRIYINVANVPVTTSPVTCTVNVNGVDRNGKKKSGLHFSSSSSVGNAQESPKIGPQCTSVCTTKVYADPKNQDRRGSYIQPLADEDVALTHNTGTVGIVALAIRNKNESKKETEFKNLSRDAPRDDVKYHPDTANKNRIPDVLPVSRTRVKLSTQPDYINANWIRDHKGQRCYIATQHPLKETMGDFWQMVWDQKANTVVMVNNEENNDSVDFAEYLPKGIGMSKRFGSIEVTVKQITDKADYTLTVLSIAKTKTESPREVSHMRFTSWKERAMPNVALFVGFVTATKEERKKYGDPKAPTIVHCSDGLGFTGVYIALDIGIKSHEESKTSVVDVFELSKNLRHDRHGIVCSLDHYNFIYQALYEYTVNCDKSEQRVLDASL